MDIQSVLHRIDNFSNSSAVIARKDIQGIECSEQSDALLSYLAIIAEDVGWDYHLARELWQSEYKNARILSTMLINPAEFTLEDAEEWVEELDDLELCDYLCNNILANTNFAYQMSFKYSKSEHALIKLTGLALMDALAGPSKNMPDAKIIMFLASIRREATDQRSIILEKIKKLLITIGKRSHQLNRYTIEVAGEIRNISELAAKLSDHVINELISEEVQNELPAPKRMIIYAAAEADEHDD